MVGFFSGSPSEKRLRSLYLSGEAHKRSILHVAPKDSRPGLASLQPTPTYSVLTSSPDSARNPSWLDGRILPPTKLARVLRSTHPVLFPNPQCRSERRFTLGKGSVPTLLQPYALHWVGLIQVAVPLEKGMRRPKARCALHGADCHDGEISDGTIECRR